MMNSSKPLRYCRCRFQRTSRRRWPETDQDAEGLVLIGGGEDLAEPGEVGFVAAGEFFVVVVELIGHALDEFVFQVLFLPDGVDGARRPRAFNSMAFST